MAVYVGSLKILFARVVLLVAHAVAAMVFWYTRSKYGLAYFTAQFELSQDTVGYIQAFISIVAMIL